MENTTVKKENGWLSLLLKIVFFLAAFVLIILTVLGNMGGSSDILKQSIEQYASQATGMEARIEKLNRMTFFPNVSFDFDNLNLTRPGESAPAARIGRVKIAMGSFDAVNGNGKVKAFFIQDVKVEPGVFYERGLTLQSFAIIDDGINPPALKGEGTFGDLPFRLSAGLAAKGKHGGRKYMLGEERPFEASVGSMAVKGTAKAKDVPGFYVEGLEASIDNQKVLGGTLNIFSHDDRAVDITADLTMEENRSDVGLALQVPARTPEGAEPVSGTVASKAFHTEDFAQGSRYRRLMDGIDALRGRESHAETKLEADIGNLFRGGTVLGSYKGALPLEDGRVDVETLLKSVQPQPQP